MVTATCPAQLSVNVTIRDNINIVVNLIQGNIVVKLIQGQQCGQAYTGITLMSSFYRFNIVVKLIHL